MISDGSGMQADSPFTHLAPVSASFHPILAQFADAERHFKRAIEIDPAYASGYGNLGMLHARMGHSAKAIALCEKALQLDPGLLQCHQTIAIVLAARGHFDEAIARLQYILSVEPGNRDAQGELDRITALKARARG